MTIKNYLPLLNEKVCLYGLLIFGFFFRLFYIFTFTKPDSYLWSDPGAYDLRALQMAKDQFVYFSTYWPPFFHIFFSFIYRFIIWFGMEGLRIKIDVVLFAFLSILSFWFIYQIAKKLFSKRTALITLIILIFWFPMIFLNSFVMSENLFLPLFFSGLYLIVNKNATLLNGALIGVLWGCALLSRPIFLFAIPLFILWAVVYKINWKFSIAFIGMILVMITLMMAFNFYYTKGAEKSISSNGGVAFAMTWCDAKFIGFNHEGYSFGFGPPANIYYPDSSGIMTNVPFENQGYYYKMGLRCLRDDRSKLIGNFFLLKKLFSSTIFPADTEVLGWTILYPIFKIGTIFLFIISIFTITWPRIFKQNWEKRKFFHLFGLIIFSLFLATYLQAVGEERYFIPYFPLLLLLSLPILNIFKKNKL